MDHVNVTTIVGAQFAQILSIFMFFLFFQVDGLSWITIQREWMM